MRQHFVNELIKRQKIVLAKRIVELTDYCDIETARADTLKKQNAELMHALELLAESWSGDFSDKIEYCRMVRKIAGDAYRKAALAKQEETK